MADDETTEEIEAEQADMEEEGSPVPSPAEAPAPEEPVAQDSGDAGEAPADDAAPAEAAAGEAPAEDDATAEAAAEEAPAAAAPAPEPVEIVHPKERRRRTRQRSSTTARPARTPEERKAERDALRVQNAKARATRRGKLRAEKPKAAAVATPEPVEAERGTQKVRQGIVVSDKAAKTITVRIDTSRRHRRYQKIVRSSKTLHAHDEHDEAHEGDLVRVVETRPLSATKRWRLVEVVERAR
jgi:small subunit ribosomal protein S17